MLRKIKSNGQLVPFMRAISLLFLATVLFSCGSSSSSVTNLTAVESDLKSKFGNNAYYTEISITSNEAIGNIINATVAKEPESMQMGQWIQTQGNWKQTSDISIEIPKGSKASDFMFQLGEKVNLKQLQNLVDKSKVKLTEDKKLNNPRMHMAFIKYPDNGDASKAEYIVMLQPETGGTTFTFSYTLSGELIKMDY